MVGFTGVYWVLLGFLQFYSLRLRFHLNQLDIKSFSLDFDGFYRVLLGFTGFSCVLLVLLGYTGFYWVYWVLLGFTGNGNQ